MKFALQNSRYELGHIKNDFHTDARKDDNIFVITDDIDIDMRVFQKESEALSYLQDVQSRAICDYINVVMLIRILGSLFLRLSGELQTSANNEILAREPYSRGDLQYEYNYL